MEKIFFHIGYPKCMSTAIQRLFFEIHPEILFGGVGLGDNISYYDNDIEDLFELSLKFSHNNYFNSKLEKYKNSINNFIDSKTTNQRAVVFSNEALSLNFSLQGIDSEIKYSRIKKVFSEYDINIVLISKPTIEIIRGIYKEYIRMGYNENYEHYLRLLIALKDRNFLSDLNVRIKREQLISVFGEKNIHIIDLNNVEKKDSSTHFCEKATKIFNLSQSISNFDSENESLSDYNLSKLLSYNRSNKIGMGKNSNEPFERHRLKSAFNTSLINFENDFIFENVLDKRKALKEFENYSFDKNFMNSIESRKLEKIVLDTIDSF